MKRWNEYYDTMEAKTRKGSKIQIQTPLNQVKSVFPRKSHANISGTGTLSRSNDPHQQPNASTATAETIFGRYVQRRSVAEPNSHQTSEGNTNFAWVE